MSRRSKSEIKYWDDKIRTMLKEVQDSGLVKNRYKAIRYLLIGKYGSQTFEDKNKTIEMLKDAIYLDRKMRLWTEGTEEVLKEQLSEEFQIEELGY